ncbi:MAG: efflux RND transporter periplasmic adaptor subunit [Parachlamydia sp.]|nr:efflux RND transporter periplasmic adaptor subunit [Parachlamydia sp.]
MRIVCILIAVLMLYSCKSKPTASKEQAPVPVHAVSPVIQDVTLYLEILGTLQAPLSVEIRPQIDGTLSEILVHEGQWVKEGAPLFKIDPVLYLIRQKEAEAQLAINKADLEAAQKKLARFQSLAEKDLLAQTEWDELKARSTKAEATLLLDQARLDAARLNLSNCMLKAPISGRIGKLDASPGQLVGKESRLASVALLDPLRLEFSVTEKDFPQIRLQEIELQPLCISMSSMPAQITFLDHQIDAQTGLLLIRAKVPNDNQKLLPGQSVRVRIPISKHEKAMLVPQKAVRYNQQGPYVFAVLPDKTIATRQLILGEEHGSNLIIKEGLDPNEPIILEGHLRLSPGTKVDIVP